MSELRKIVPNFENSEELKVVVNEVSKAFGDAIRKHPEKALGIGGGLVGLYILKNKKIKFKFKNSDLDIEFETE